MDYLKLTFDKLSVEEVNDIVVDDGCGAIALFVGTTRDNFEGKKVTCLEYEAYESMALKALKSICEDTRKKWPDVHNLAIYHRLGKVPIREASVVIAVSTPHRRDALDAVSHCIDQLKSTVPIWKKELYDTHPPAWKENKECTAPQTKDQDESTIDKNLVQINVSSDEISKRIQNFMERKREQVNISNIQDFIPGAGVKMEVGGESGDTCARVRTQFVRRHDSKSHLKIHKVNNEWGPQTMKAPIKTEPMEQTDPSLPAAISERVRNIERYLNIGPVSRDIYKRLKHMEDKIAHLETMSPEYAQFWHGKNTESKATTELVMEMAFSSDDIARKIEQLENLGEV